MGPPPQVSGGEQLDSERAFLCAPHWPCHTHTHTPVHVVTQLSHAFKHMPPQTCVVTRIYLHTRRHRRTHTHRWIFEALSTASPPPPGVFPVNSRLCVSRSSLGWLDGGSGHRQACGSSCSLPTSGPSQASPWDLTLLRSSRSPYRFWESSESDGGAGQVSGVMLAGLAVPVALGLRPPHPDLSP